MLVMEVNYGLKGLGLVSCSLQELIVLDHMSDVVLLNRYHSSLVRLVRRLVDMPGLLL